MNGDIADAAREKQRGVHLAWQNFVQGKPVDPALVDRPILAGWEKSRAMGVDPYRPVMPPVLSRRELERLDNYEELLTCAAPMLGMLSASIHQTGYIATLALASGHLIAVVGDDELMHEARRMYNIPGALRSVEVVGSSAIWICLTERKPLQVTGYEHYCQNLHQWKCSAAPVFDESEDPIGVLVISSHISQKDIHTLTLAKSCADGISIRLRENRLLNNLQRVNAVLQSSLDSLPETVVTVDEDGAVTHANSNASLFHDNASESLVGKTIHELFSASDVRKVQQIMQKSGIQTADLEIRTPHGPQNKLCRFVPIRLGSGKYGGTIISIPSLGQLIDITKHVSGNYAKYAFSDIKGGNAVLLKQLELAKRAAATQAGILLTGESGTGKELFAQAIHNASSVANGPFVAISCAAIPRDLIESELFGYVGGAFTGARKNGMIGKVELASGGTLFLDEVNSLPLDMQAKFLRALQQREIVRIGDTKPTHVDIRVIAATNVDLKIAMKQSLFREDLYYRLNVVEIVIPPLRERGDDIELLVNVILNRQCLDAGLSFAGISRNAMQMLQEYAWPGNIRELENTCERALLVSAGATIEVEHLPAHIVAAITDENIPPETQSPVAAPQPAGQYTTIERAYSDVIANAMRRYNGNISKVAAHLGIARSTLYRKMRKLDVSWQGEV